MVGWKVDNHAAQDLLFCPNIPNLDSRLKVEIQYA